MGKHLQRDLELLKKEILAIGLNRGKSIERFHSCSRQPAFKTC